MDQKNKVLVVEEEKFGWTILSTVQDDERAPFREKLATQPEPDPVVGTETDAGVDRHEGAPPVGEQKNEAENEESDEPEEFARDEEDDDADDELDDYGFDDGADDGDEAKVFPFGESGRVFLWDTEPSTKQALVQQQPEQKQGVMWGVSLVATLGFFGWVVMSSLSGGGKNIRCLKLHPCSVKDGEPVLGTL